MSPPPPREAGGPGREATTLLALAAVAVAFAAADTYVVVLALPDMMTSTGIPIDQLQRAAPIVSGFLLGYVAMLPLIGRIADLRGRLPVLTWSLAVFAVGCLVTAASYDLGSLVTGRFLQGLGGGGLVPATLALVADLYPADRRGVPLGVVSAVQEVGSVIGPLVGALVLAVADWRAIFALNLAVALVLAGALRWVSRAERPRPSRPRRVPDPVALVLLAAYVGAMALVALQPPGLMRDLTWGRLFIPYAGDGRWLTPIGLLAIGALVLLLARLLLARRPLVDLRGWWSTLREADLTGACLLAAALAGVILAFATADPAVQVFAARGYWALLASLVAAVLLVVHLRRTSEPLLPRGALVRTPAWGSLVTSFLIGSALIAALIDIPLFARTTVYRDSQLLASLVLLRFLVGVPVGAVAGGYLTRRVPVGVITAVGMVMAALGFWAMARWEAHSLPGWPAEVALIVGGLGFGLALAPVNAALLASTDAAVHGVTTALVVVARMVGMLVGISALTTIGLRRYYAAPESATPLERAVAQEHAVFLGAAGCAVLAGIAALVLFRGVTLRGATHLRPARTGPGRAS